jgi:hypothetical protein
LDFPDDILNSNSKNPEESSPENEEARELENTALHHVAVGTVFLLDGAPLHFSNCVYAFLVKKFPNCWIGQDAHTLVPSFSIYDSSVFFILGLCKRYRHEKVKNANELCGIIITAAEYITNDKLANTWQETEYCLAACCATTGTHTEI